MKISTNKFVSVSYDLHVGDDNELELMERATTEQPLQFIFGMGSMLPAFEDGLKNMTEGESFKMTLTPENAYGERNEENVVELPKNIFEVDGKFDDEFIAEGSTVPMMDASGQRLHGSVLEVRDDVVVMDFNHPLAGETLHFEGKILDVHEATAEEIAASSAALNGGGCGCGDRCGDGCGDGQQGCGSGCGCS